MQSVLAQPKRLALLVYLASPVTPPFVRRDTLLGLFWPEHDQERGRAALRKAVHYLRRSLRDGAVVGRGDDELRVPPDVVQIDVTAFEQALDDRRPADALALYEGDLLPGLSVPDAPEFGRWLDGERERLRRRAIEGAWAAVEAAMEGRGPGWEDAALRWSNLATYLAPWSEDTLRRRLEVLAAVGDRTTAIAEYETFARRIEKELELTPSLETLGLVETIRAASGQAVPTSDAQTEPVGRPEEVVYGNGSDTVPGSVAGGGGARPAVRSTAAVARAGAAAVFLTLLAVVGVVWGWPASRTPALAGSVLEPDRVAVLPFAVRGSAAQAYLSDGMAVLLANALDGAGRLATVVPGALLGTASRTDDPGTSSPAGLAARFGAGLFISGSVLGSGDLLQVEATLYEVEWGERGWVSASPRVRALASGGESALVQLVEDLATRILAGHLDERGDRMAGAAIVSTGSLPALKAYLRGEAALRDASFDQAVASFEEAVAADSTFALAHYQLSVAANWAGRMELVSPALLGALRHRERLSGRVRLLVEGAELRNQSAQDAARLYRSILDRYPDDVEAAMELAELQFHRGPLIGQPVLAARDGFERVLRRRPDDLTALIHLARIAALEQDHEVVDRVTSLILEQRPAGDLVPEARFLRALALGDEAAGEYAVAARDRIGDVRIFDALWRASAYTGSLADAARLARSLARPADPPEWQAAAHLIVAHLEMARGRVAAADTALLAVAASSPAVAAQARILFAALPFLPPSISGRLALHTTERVLTRTDSTAPVLQGIYRGHPLWETSDPTAGNYFLGVAAVTAGDLHRARHHADALADLYRESSGSIDLLLARTELDLRIDRFEGEPRRGIARMQPLLDGFSRWTTSASPVRPRASVRFLHAEQLRAERQLYAALDWYATIPEDLGFDLIYLAPAHLRRAEILDQMGRHEEARNHYARFLRLWADADPDLRALAEGVEPPPEPDPV